MDFDGERGNTTLRDQSENSALPTMVHSTFSKYEHQFELELVDEAVEHETDELKKLKDRYRKSCRIRKAKPVVEEKKNKRKRNKSVEDKIRIAKERKEALQQKKMEEKVEEMEPMGMGNVWMTRRRVDGRIFLAQEFEDPYGFLEAASESLLRLLNHNNLVSLVDIVQSDDEDPNFMVWEYCQRGTLSRVLRIYDSNFLQIPESFCWHVLHSLTQSLLWLHKGVKIDSVTDSAVSHDDDWHTVLIGDIRPTNIFFTAAEGDRPFGLAKLGCFYSSTVCIDSKTVEPNDGPPELTEFQPPEIVEKFGSWTPEAEIWNLGAVIYRMMVGHPPDLTLYGIAGESLEQTWARKMPRKFSSQLRDTVTLMLDPEPAGRPGILWFWSVMNQNFIMWKQLTKEGRLYAAVYGAVSL